MAFAMPEPVYAMPEPEMGSDGQSVRSQKTSKTNKTTVSTTSTLMTKMTGRSQAVGADDPLEVLSQCDYTPIGGSCFDPRFPETIWRPADMPKGPSAAAKIGAAVAPKLDMVAARMEDTVGAKKGKGTKQKRQGPHPDTIQGIQEREAEWGDVQEEFQLYVEEQASLGRRVEGDMNQFTMARQTEAKQMEAALRPYQPPPPRRTRREQMYGEYGEMEMQPMPSRAKGGRKARAPKKKPLTMTVGQMLAAEEAEQEGEYQDEGYGYEEEYAEDAYQGPGAEYGAPQRGGYQGQGRPPARPQQPRRQPRPQSQGYYDDYGYEQGYGQAAPRGRPQQPQQGYQQPPSHSYSGQDCGMMY